MGSRMIRDRSKDGRWWLIVGLFTVCVVGWSLAFSFKVGAANTAAAQDSGRQDQITARADRVWNLSDFNRIRISGSPGVTLVQGDIERVSATGDDNAIERLEVVVSGDELIVRNKRRFWIGDWFGGWRDSRVDLVIEFIDLEGLALSGSSQVRAAALRSPEFNLSVSGSGSTNIDQLLGDSLNIRVSGSGDIDVAGVVDRQVIGISGSADYEARDLATQATTIRVSGSGEAHVAASTVLDVRVSGSGSVRYLGEPEVSSSISGSGDIRQL